MTTSRPKIWLKTPASNRELLVELSWDAFALDHVVHLYVSDKGLDGRMPKAKLDVAVNRLKTGRQLQPLIRELVELPKWVDAGDHWTLIGWGEDQPPAKIWSDTVQRERWARDKRLKRDSELCNRIKKRDGNRCRYCGIRVNWASRHPDDMMAGTYDHVDPDGDNSSTNVVVACKGCNSKKNERTPQQAGMPLYHPGTTDEQIARATARVMIAASPAAGPPAARGGEDTDDATSDQAR